MKPRILFIFAKWPKRTLWGHFRYKFPALGLLTIAGATPPEYEVSFIDENMDEVDFNADVEIVALSVMTPLAKRSYEIADIFRSRGKKVVLGGIHASVLPEEALRHADAVVVGEGEKAWLSLLSDYKHGRLQKIYRSESFSDLADAALARRDLLQSSKYVTKATVQLTRGCPYNCEYCSVTAFFGRKFRSRPLEQFCAEYHSLPGRFVFIVDDNIMSNRGEALQLFQRIRGSGKWWGSQVPITVADDQEALKAMALSGCKSLFIGFESLEQDNLQQMGKGFVAASKHADRIKRIQDSGIGIQGSFIVGCDYDTPRTFETLYEFIIRTRLNAFLISVLTPFPGIKLTERLLAEDRIISKDWEQYDMNTVVYRPKNFTPDDLQRRYDELNQSLYGISSIMQRSLRFNSNVLLFVPQNFGFRQAWRELKKYQSDLESALAVYG